MNNSIAVIGSGITGVMTAYYFARKGYRVHVFEKEKYPASKCSFANGGQISVSNSEVWNSWGNIKRGIGWIGQSDAPLLIKPTLDLHLFKWLWKFMLASNQKTANANTSETIRMGIQSRQLYLDLIKETGIEFDQSNCGILHFYKDEKYFQHAKDIKELYESNGCEWKILDNKGVFDIEPTLAQGRQYHEIIGGAWTSDDWTGDINKFCKNLLNYLIKAYDVEYLFMTSTSPHYVDTVLSQNYRAVVIAAGANSQEFAVHYGDDILIYPVKGYSITIDVDHKYHHMMPKTSLLDDQAKIVTSTLGSRLRVAGTAEFAGENYDITRSRIEPLIKWTESNFPYIDISNYSSWACLRPMTPNMLPVIKKSKRGNIWYNTGHGHLGWTLAAATAKRLSDMIV